MIRAKFQTRKNCPQLRFISDINQGSILVKMCFCIKILRLFSQVSCLQSHRNITGQFLGNFLRSLGNFFTKSSGHHFGESTGFRLQCEIAISFFRTCEK
jgi:hypothetical protein